MQRQSVQSSNIASIGYESNSQVLEVEFNDGSIYQYFNIPSNVHEGIMSASSHGRYLHAHIKDQYPYQRS